jgi:hypothetical protein
MHSACANPSPRCHARAFQLTFVIYPPGSQPARRIFCHSERTRAPHSHSISKKEVAPCRATSLTSVTHIKLRENHNQERRAPSEYTNTYTAECMFSVKCHVKVSDASLTQNYFPRHVYSSQTQGFILMREERHEPLFGLISPQHVPAEIVWI